MTVGERIKAARQAANITQKELAKRLGVTPALIGHYERGERNPKQETIKRIAAALKVHETDLQRDDLDEIRDKVIGWMDHEKNILRIDTSKSIDLTSIFERAKKGTLTPEDIKILEEERRKLPEVMERVVKSLKEINDILSSSAGDPDE